MRKHKYCCTAAGYDFCGDKPKWWNHPSFPIVPMFEIVEGDEWNAKSWNLSWLWLRLWSLEHFQLELAIEIETTGLNIKAIIPYVRIVVRVIPMPYWWLDKLRRNPSPKKERND